MKRTFTIGFFFLLALSLWANGKSQEYQGIMVSIPPQEYLLEQITGDLIEVNSLLSPQDNAHNFNPVPSSINRLSQSKIYFPVGIGLEGAFLDDIKVTLPNLEIHELQESIELIEIAANHHHEEDHHEEDHARNGHNTNSLDPHFWLGIHQTEQWLTEVLPLLTTAYPEHKEALESNYQQFLAELKEFESQLDEMIPQGETQLFAAHPAFGYFCHHFGVNQLVVEVEGKEPTPRQLEEIIEDAQQRNIEALVVQPQFNQLAARTIAEAIDGEVVTINPLAYDWKETMEQLAQAVQRSH